jgi:predicted Zn-dependent protease
MLQHVTGSGLIDMINTTSKLNLVRIGSYITYSSLKKIGEGILESFRGVIKDIDLTHHDSPVVESIDAQLLTMILDEEYGGHTLGITDADLKTKDRDEFYNSILGGKNPKNDVAIVSTKKLTPQNMTSDMEYDLFIDRTLKVSLHEVGHNFGLTDHSSYKTARDGLLCPMSRGEYNKFGYKGYVKIIIDGRGLNFCDNCAYFLNKVYGFKRSSTNFLTDGLVDSTRSPLKKTGTV